jgi:CheY-like chemotaxis protein
VRLRKARGVCVRSESTAITLPVFSAASNSSVRYLELRLTSRANQVIRCNRDYSKTGNSVGRSNIRAALRPVSSIEAFQNPSSQLMPHDESSAAPAALPPVVILVVEDLDDLRNNVSEYFRLSHFQVVATANAHEALAAIDSGRHIDLVFTDVNMPGAMDGVGLVKWLAVNRPRLPAIITSGVPHPEVTDLSPLYRFVQKPYFLDVLEHDIREIVATMAA